MMKYNVAADARPQLKTLLIATAISIALWFIPFADYLAYPFKLFVTFIHESAHAIAAVLTMSSVYSLTVSPDTSGQVLAAPDSWLASLIISSAGYVGATVFGALLLVLIRRAASARIVLAGIGVYIALVTAFFGFVLPVWNFTRAETTFFGLTFTVASGFLLSAALLLVARFANAKVATFSLAFLAVQCVLNAFYDLKTLFFASASLFNPMQSDANNMAQATYTHPLVWVLVWTAVSLVAVSIALRFYAVRKTRTNAQQDLPFED